MRISEDEIKEELAGYYHIDFRDSFSLREVWQHVGAPERESHRVKYRKGFSWKNKSPRFWSNYQRRRIDMVTVFAETLIETGNLEWARKNSALGYFSAWHYIGLFNREAIDRGLPAIFTKKENWARPNVKLNEKQVANIKYLCTKYSLKGVAKMYNVSPATINQIKWGCTWKHVKPAILNTNPVRLINQYKKTWDGIDRSVKKYT